MVWFVYYYPSTSAATLELCWSGVRGKINRTVQLCSIVQHYVVVQQCLEQFNGCLNWVLSYWVHFSVLRFIFVYAYFVFIICCIIVTWCCGPGGIQA